MVQLVAYLSRPVGGYDDQGYAVHCSRGSVLSNQRQDLLNMAMKTECSHLLFLDADMTFPKDLVHRLVAHGKDVVACNCPTKAFPSYPTAKLKSRPGDVAGRDLYSNGRSGLQKVWRIGTGVMLIDLRIFRDNKKLRRPAWFDITWVPQLGKYMGEDWSFCRRLEHAGVDIWIDHDLSLEIGHVGLLEWTHDYIEVPKQGVQAHG
jgi:hypothetical protein